MTINFTKYKNMAFLRFLINVLILSLLFTNNLYSSEDFLDYKLDITIDPESRISMKNIAENEIIKGTIFGKTNNTPYEDFNNTSLECELLGRSYKGRGFSCGFAVVEDLKGICFLRKLNSEDILITSWSCNTTAGFNGEPSCKGKFSIVEGFGKFAGVLGFGEIEMPLSKTLSEKKQSYLMQLKIKIKYPLDIKKN